MWLFVFQFRSDSYTDGEYGTHCTIEKTTVASVGLYYMYLPWDRPLSVACNTRTTQLYVCRIPNPSSTYNGVQTHTHTERERERGRERERPCQQFQGECSQECIGDLLGPVSLYHTVAPPTVRWSGKPLSSVRLNVTRTRWRGLW